MDRAQLHLRLVEKHDTAMDFFKEKSKSCIFPIYTSVDIRDAGFKVTPVDANLYPAGFNNMCDMDKEYAPDILKDYIVKHYGSSFHKILLITEENTSNLFYWDNIWTIMTMIKEAGFECKVGFPIENVYISEVNSASGRQILLSKLSYDEKGHLLADDMRPDLIISNNDFTKIYPLLQNQDYPINPPQEMGWHSRKKHNHFSIYNELSKEFCSLLNIDPWLFKIDTRLIENFYWKDVQSLENLASKVQDLIDNIQKEYDDRKISSKAFAFIKNNSGTYGMGIAQVTSGEDVLQWNNKMRQKMRKGKGGVDIIQLIIQEGIPSHIREEELVAEPVIYMIGDKLIGGFLRTHGLKSDTENLNSPGAIFKRLCITDLKTNRYGLPLENIYGTISWLMKIAISKEAVLLKAKFHKYKQ